MEIDFLRHFGFSADLIRLLQAAYGSALLPLQERVIREGRLFEGESLLVSAPTSSGKTFLAEILFLFHAIQGRNAILLVPAKALANQRFDQLRRRYREMGYRILLSTRDHPDDDRRIREGRFHLAVVIYEKMRSLLAGGDAFLASLGACIVDEAHYLFHPERGPDLEILLTRLREEKRLQMLALSAVLADDPIGKWLGGRTIREKIRPVELRQGVLCGKHFTYQEFNTHGEGRETFPLVESEDEGELMLQAARHFAAQGEITLLFWPRRDLCYTAARKLAERMEPEDSGSTDDLERLENTAIKEFLAYLLPRRTAVHTSDLSPAERTVVEQAVQRGEVSLICATGTLAEGINFPVVNVLTTRRMYAVRPEDISKKKPPMSIPIAQDRLFNMIGRAGRLGLSDFGRGIIVTTSPADVEGLMNSYLRSEPPAASPLLVHSPLKKTILQALGMTGRATRAGCVDFLHRTLSGVMNLWPDRWESQVASALEQLKQERFLSEDVEYFSPTPLGNLVIKNGLSLDSARRLDRFVEDYYPAQASALELWVWICLSDEIEEVYLFVSRSEIRNHVWSRALMQAVETDGLSADSWVRGLLNSPAVLLPAHHAAFKKSILLRDWAAGESWSYLEKRYGVYSGLITRLAEDAAWLIGCLTEAVAGRAVHTETLHRLVTLQKQVLYGIPASGLEWADFLRRRELTRSQVLSLIQAGYPSPAKIREEDREALQALLPPDSLETICKNRRPVAEAPLKDFTYIIEIDSARNDRITVNGREITLTKLQARLMQVLLNKPGQCVDYETLVREIWKESYGDKRQLSRQKNLIKKKVEKALGRSEAQLIEAVRGIGLILNATIRR